MSHQETSTVPFFRSPLLGEKDQHRNNSGSDEDTEAKPLHQRQKTDDASLQDNPQFHRHTEATNAELFYDLFLVANLTVFTSVHEVNDGKSLKQYVGFFAILWFTWYQVSLYDVRFAMDSVFERIARALQFMVMVLLAIVGPRFDVGQRAKPGSEEGPSLGYYRALTLGLMISRLVLVLQYIQAMWFTRHYKKTRVPMILVASTYFAAAMIYLGLYWTFHRYNSKGGNHTYIVWYVVAILETIMATLVSSVWRNISFKGTHLVQRMALLTLIILGEGIIGVAKKCQMIVKSNDALYFSASTIGNILCAVLILYFIYMIYFDWLEEEHFGTIRQQIWSFLHFPLHVALVLAVEGVAQCITWRAAVERNNKIYNDYYQVWNNTAPTTPASVWSTIANEINSTAMGIIHTGVYIADNLHDTLTGLNDYQNAQNATAVIADGANGTSDFQLAHSAVNWAFLTISKTVFGIAGFSPAEKNATERARQEETQVVDFLDQDAIDEAFNEFDKSADVFYLTYVYFFVAIGFVVIVCCLIAALSQRQKRKLHWTRLALSTVVGIGLALLATMGVASDGVAGSNFILSPWLLPCVTISLFIVVVLNNVRPTIPDISKKGWRKDKR